MRQRLAALLFGDNPPSSHAEKWISGLGALLGIAATYGIAATFLAPGDVPLLVASMGASAVLVFAVPHGALAQPWPLLGGNLISSAIGVTCARFVADPVAAAALAVACAVVAMYYLRCLHPPGGATALIAVIGGPSVHALGYQFVLTPIALNVLAMFGVALVFNAFFPWRRYPAALVRRATPPEEHAGVEPRNIGVTHEDLAHALAQINSFVDVSEQDLADIYKLALDHSQANRMKPEQVVAGRTYSNGRYGDDWSVRSVVDESGVGAPERDKVIFRVVAGRDRRMTGTCTRAEFARWARYEVERHEDTWRRVGTEDAHV
jgi:CBS-domain-containing membrane protein